MEAMFLDCNEIEFLDLSFFNTNNVNNMRLMFDNCFKLKVIN